MEFGTHTEAMASRSGDSSDVAMSPGHLGPPGAERGRRGLSGETLTETAHAGQASQ